MARTLVGDDIRPLGIALIRAGSFHDQARLLLEAGEVKEDGSLRCRTRVARSSAPQLVGLLTLWDEVIVLPSLSIPAGLVIEIRSVWALVPPEAELPPWIRQKKKIGNRAETYSYEFERTRSSNPASIKWVSLDSDSFGFDLEDTSSSPSRAIEVKGRGNDEVVFFLSDREWEVARQRGESYELQFWGEIDLSRPPPTEYAALRAAGYPLCIRNIGLVLAGAPWRMTPIKWRVERL